jgi:hypothetical protein
MAVAPGLGGTRCRRVCWVARMAEVTRRNDTSSFVLTLATSGEEPGNYAIESVQKIDRRAALKTLKSFGLTPIPLSVLPGSLLARKERNGSETRRAGAARIEVVRLSPRQTLRMLGVIRRQDPNVRGLYADLEGKGFALMRSRARGTVMRAYSADGVARGGGIVVELPHEGPDGAIAVFHVSAKEGIDGEGDSGNDEASADYSIRRGARVETYAIEDKRTRREGGWARCWCRGSPL